MHWLEEDIKYLRGVGGTSTLTGRFTMVQPNPAAVAIRFDPDIKQNIQMLAVRSASRDNA
jgi:hypothetical protein